MDKAAIIIQARMSSSRFPGKMMSLCSGIPLIEYIYRRCRQSKIPNVIVATSTDRSDDTIYDFCSLKDIPVYRGLLKDVLQRYIEAAQGTGVYYIARVCGDSPLVDIGLLEKLLDMLITEKFDYVSCDRKFCLAGFYSEAVTLAALKRSRSMTEDPDCLEHVTKFIIEHPTAFSVKFIKPGLMSKIINDVKLTIDYPRDMVLVNRILEQLPDKQVIDSKTVIQVISSLKV